MGVFYLLISIWIEKLVNDKKVHVITGIGFIAFGSAAVKVNKGFLC